MTIDHQFESHRQMWISFTRLMKWSIAGIILALVVLRVLTL